MAGTHIQALLSEVELPLKLKWKRGKDLPFTIDDWAQAVVLLDKVYIGGGSSVYDEDKRTVIVYDPQHDSYDTLQPYTYRSFSMTALKNQLVLVGGLESKGRKKTDKLAVWNGQWTHPLPPMTTVRSSPSVITHKDRWIVVMGGGDDSTVLTSVEILDTSESSQWYQAAPLPHPCFRVVPVTIGDTCYLLGGYSTKGYVSRRATCVSINSLVTQAIDTSQPASSSPAPSLWQILPDVPHTYSTPLAVRGTLLLIGGHYSEDIFHYQPNSKSWVKVGETPTTRTSPTCTVLPGSGEVFVAGGHMTDTRVDIATVL